MSRWWLAAAAAGLVLVGVVAGAQLRGTGTPSRDDRPPASTETDTAGRRERAGPAAAARTAPGGVPVGWSQDRAGATAAGIAYGSAAQAWLYLSDEEIADSLAAIATPDAAAALTAETVSAVALARDALAASPGQVWWVVRPLASRLVSYADDRAAVAVWTVSVLSAADVAVPQSAWVTATVELAWSAGDWRLAALTERPGPTPVVDNSDQPWQPEALEQTLAGFELLPVGR